MGSVALVLLSLLAAPEEPSPGTYSIAPLESAFVPDAKVGSRRAGLLCGPAGSLRWRDVKPADADVTRASATAMRAHGVDMFVPSIEWLNGRGPATPYRLVPTIDALSVRACLPHAGPLVWAGASRRVKASGEISITWRNYDARSRRLVWSKQVSLPFRYDDDAADVGVVVTSAVAASAARLAETMPDELSAR